MRYTIKTGLKTVTNRNTTSRNQLKHSNLQSANRNKKCYGNRNKKCYDLLQPTICKSVGYRVPCYDLLRLKSGVNSMNINELAINRNKKTVTKYIIRKNGQIATFNEILFKARGAGDIYKMVKPGHYENLSTGSSGVIPDHIVAKHLVLPVRLNLMQYKNASMLYLIEELGLAISE